MPIGAAVMAASYIRITGMCVGRANAELKKQHMPGKRTDACADAKRSDMHHRNVCWKGKCGTITKRKIMEFRPCIDIHNGKVKQIVGGSLKDQGDQALENFVSQQDAAFYARLYRSAGIRGGHIILLNGADSPHFEATRQQAFEALAAPAGCRWAAASMGATPGNIWMRALPRSLSLPMCSMTAGWTMADWRNWRRLWAESGWCWI